MNWIETIKKIREAQENNRLVIFVGAGVSKNSGLPSWGQLVDSIAQKIGYDKCSLCSQRSSCKVPGKCSFTQEELLRIPEYFYQTDHSELKKEYYDFIASRLTSTQPSNSINDQILRILPHHIITTNYDHLLEECTSANVHFYQVIKTDQDMLSAANDRYIVKMHGDIDRPSSMVLKESDYIDYEQNHPLISTFIRSLLINHTFLFVGYSLNDYNFNLIIGWINYFQKNYNIKNCPSNFLVDAKTPSEYEVTRLQSKNIYPIGLDTLPSDLDQKTAVPKELTDKVGRQLYTFLDCITDVGVLNAYIPLRDVLGEKYALLAPYKRISWQDLLQVQNLGQAEVIADILLFHNKNWYDQVSELVKDNDTNVLSTFRKAGIAGIQLSEDEASYLNVSSTEADSAPWSKLFSLYLNNEYATLLEQSKSLADPDQIQYYQYLITGQLLPDAHPGKNSDYISLLLHQIRLRLYRLNWLNRQEARTRGIEQWIDSAPFRYRPAIRYITKLFQSTASDMKRMAGILQNQEKRYQYRINGWRSGQADIEILRLQAYAYDFYFFTKENAIPLDYFQDGQNYLSYYLQAILCSYSPIDDSYSGNFFDVRTERGPYTLQEIDVDMFTKYVKPRDFLAWLKKYHVQELHLSDNIDIAVKFKNLCDSFLCFDIAKWLDFIANLSIIVCLTALKQESLEIILDSLSNILEQKAVKDPTTRDSLFDATERLLYHCNDAELCKSKKRLLNDLLDDRLYINIKHLDFRLSRMFKKLAPYADTNIRTRAEKLVESASLEQEKCDRNVLLHSLLPVEKYVSYLCGHLDLLDIRFLFDLIHENIIPFSTDISDYLLNVINQEVKKRESQQGYRVIPDSLAIAIHAFILFSLMGERVDLSNLAPYAQYDKFLEFILAPDEFDYTKVDTRDYLWQRLISSKQYQRHFVNHRKDILTNELKQAFLSSNTTREQQKIVYGILLQKDELFEFE